MGEIPNTDNNSLQLQNLKDPQQFVAVAKSQILAKNPKTDTKVCQFPNTVNSLLQFYKIPYTDNR